jgi:nucleoside-diphosphate kinase
MSDLQRTLSIVKPDAVAAGATGDILSRFESAGLTIIALKKMQLTVAQARGFYAVHKSRPFFADLVAFMTAKNRELMGPTDSTQAEPGTIRGDHGTDIERNAVHGSDAPETARVEIAYFFNATEVQAPVEALPA